MYVNPYLVLRSGGYTRHFYIGGQRVTSKLGRITILTAGESGKKERNPECVKKIPNWKDYMS